MQNQIQSLAHSYELRAFRSTVRHAESLWKFTHSALDLPSFKSLHNQYHKLIQTSERKQYFENLVLSVSDNPMSPKSLWQAVYELPYRKSSSPLPSSSRGISFADSFVNFISLLYLLHLHTYCPFNSTYNYSSLRPAFESEISKILSSCLCLHDLSAVFNTIDHNILITHLSSWFGIHGSVLNWFILPIIPFFP